MCIPVGHHPYIAHYLGLDSRIAFTKKVADVYSFTTSRTTTYELEIPFHPDMPLINGLYSKKTIRWYLRHGFVPTVIGRKITFIKESNDKLNAILSFCDQVASEYHVEVLNPMDDLEESFITIDLEEEVVYEAPAPKPPVDNSDLIRQLIVDFKGNLENGQARFAQECIQKAYELDPLSTALKELYAEYLLLRKDMRAARLFVELSQTKEGANSIAFLEKALASDPTNEDLIAHLLRATNSPSRKVNQCLYAFLHSWKIDQARAEALYQQALRLSPQEPFVFLSRLSCLSDKHKKTDVLRELAAIFQRRQDEQVTKYYLRKIPGGLQRYIAETPSKKVVKARPPLAVLPIRSKSCPKLCTIFVQELAGEGFMEVVESYFTVTKEAKQSYLDLIDQHIKRGESRQAEEAIGQARGRCGDTSSLLKRMYKVCSDVDALKQLWGVYTKKAKVAKAEVVARLIYEHTQDFESGWRVATCLAMQGKVRMSAQGYYALAKSSQRLSNYDAMAECLEKIEAIDPTYASFVSSERTIIYLLHLASRINKKEGFAVDLATEKLIGKLAFSPTKKLLKAGTQVTGLRCEPYEATIAFAVDHPEYVACWCDWEQKVLFTKATAEVFSSRSGKKSTLALRLPGSEDLPDEIQLFEHKTILWYLQEGFVPVQQNGAMTFVLPSKAFLMGAVAKLLQACMAFYLQNDRVVYEQLQKVKVYFENEQHSLATALLQKMTAIRIKKLYAEYLAFCKSPKAYSLFLELSRETRGDESCIFLEKAFLLDPQHEGTYDRIVKCEPPKAQVLTLCLFAYVHLIKTNPVKAGVFYAKALKLDCSDPFMHFAFVERVSKGDRVQKMKAYAGIVDVFKQQGVREYYLQKKQLMNSMATLDGIKNVLEGECARISIQLLEKFCVQVLDILLEEQAYEMAEEVLCHILRLFQRRCPVSIYARQIGEDDERYNKEGDLFLLREIEIYSQLGKLDKLKDVLKRLEGMYQNTKTHKAFIVSKLKHERCRDLATGNQLASRYISQGMQRQAVEVHLDNAFWCILQKFFVNSDACVQRARIIDAEGRITTDDEKAMMGIIESIAKLPAVVARI